VAAQQNAGNQTGVNCEWTRSYLLYSCCNSFFICDVHGVFGLINVHLFDVLPAISSRKVRDFFVWRVVIPITVHSVLV